MILRARIVLPISRPPIQNGAVRIAGSRIIDVGRWPQLSSAPAEEVADLGEVILLPGLVNSHCHLDYTDMAGMFPPPRQFTDWIKALTATKAEWSYSDYAGSWLNGAKMLARTGTTTVGDIEALPDLLPEVWQATPLRVLSFLEMTGVKSRRAPALIVEEASEAIADLPATRCHAGLSPHAPYSTVPELLRIAGDIARRKRWRLCTHVAESAQEFKMFTKGIGEMFDWLKRSGRDMSDCGYGTPVQHIYRNGMLGPNLLAVHVNYLGDGDISLLKQNQVSVAHCPRSHHYFQHGPFPFQELSKNGINICLGTDSLASVYKTRRERVELDMFSEMRLLAENQPATSPETIVKMATINGAKALGLEKCVGHLSSECFADCITVPFKGKLADACNAIINHRGDVSGSMVDGAWIAAPMAET
jgi:cytosine/adenosine deaminase-related metal-dependent hydrolase